MNRRPSGLSVAKALSGFLQYKSAEGLAPTTLVGYEHDVKSWIEYVGDMDVAEVHSGHILSFLSYLRTDYIPHRLAGDNSRKLTPKTVYNIYISLASFYTWASREFGVENPMKAIPRPRVPADARVQPFKKEEVEALIKACDFCDEADTERRRKYVAQRSTGRRDKAILLTLLDTGLRASELCALRISDVDLKSGRGRSGRVKPARRRAGRGALCNWANPLGSSRHCRPICRGRTLAWSAFNQWIQGSSPWSVI